jgi:lysozyme
MAEQPSRAAVAPVNAKQRATAAIAAAVLVSAPLTASFEGVRTHPYHDPYDGRWTVCAGDTKVEMRVYTPDECQVLLEARQRRDYAPIVLNCVPAFADPKLKLVFAASIDAGYNGGPGAKRGFCGSPMAANFNRGEWRSGCDAFPAWHTLPGTNVHNGLVRRRNAERSLCLKGIPA